MTARPQQWPIVDVDIIARLRSQLDEERARNVALTAERDALKATLLGEAALADGQRELAEHKGAPWWMAAWRYVSRHRTELMHRVQQLEQWCREHGTEATRLQTELEAARQEIGLLTRQLELARAGERCDAGEVD